MKTKNFEYYHRDIKQLKIDIFFRCLFSALFLGIFIWQLISVFTKENLSNLHIIVSVVVLICSLMLAVITFVFAFKDLRIIATIKMAGKCVSSVQILFSTKKNSFIKMYAYLIQFLTLATTLILVASITYTILQISYMSTISFYMPLLLLVCVAGYNAIYHIKDEIRTQDNVHEQQPLY